MFKIVFPTFSVCGEQASEVEVIHDLNELRPTTPLETSQSEPLLSKSSGGSVGHALPSPTPLGGTYRLGDGGKICDLIKVGGAKGVALQQAEELEQLNESALESKKQLTTADEKCVHFPQSLYESHLFSPKYRLSRAEEEHRNLNLKIRFCSTVDCSLQH